MKIKDLAKIFKFKKRRPKDSNFQLFQTFDRFTARSIVELAFLPGALLCTTYDTA